jgi:hypothetical protein
VGGGGRRVGCVGSRGSVDLSGSVWVNTIVYVWYRNAEAISIV